MAAMLAANSRQGFEVGQVRLEERPCRQQREIAEFALPIALADQIQRRLSVGLDRVGVLLDLESGRTVLFERHRQPLLQFQFDCSTSRSAAVNSAWARMLPWLRLNTGSGMPIWTPATVYREAASYCAGLEIDIGIPTGDSRPNACAGAGDPYLARANCGLSASRRPRVSSQINAVTASRRSPATRASDIWLAHGCGQGPPRRQLPVQPPSAVAPVPCRLRSAPGARRNVRLRFPAADSPRSARPRSRPAPDARSPRPRAGRSAPRSTRGGRRSAHAAAWACQAKSACSISCATTARRHWRLGAVTISWLRNCRPCCPARPSLPISLPL